MSQTVVIFCKESQQTHETEAGYPIRLFEVEDDRTLSTKHLVFQDPVSDLESQFNLKRKGD